MINSTSSQQGMPSTAAVDLAQSNLVSRRALNAHDSLSTANAEMLKAKLSSEPEVRPKIVQSPDPSETQD